MITAYLAAALGRAAVSGLTVDLVYGDNGIALMFVVSCVPCDLVLMFNVRPAYPDAIVTHIIRLITHLSEDEHAPWPFAEA